MSGGEDGGAQLQCCVTTEHLNASGQAARRQVIRKASVLLGRNEFQELILRIHDGKMPQNYLLKNFKLFTKFAREGKCTVKLLPENIQVLISNCPPDQLSLFLRTLSIKHQAGLSRKTPSGREKLKAGLPRCFEPISPLQQKDIQKINELRSNVPPKGLSDRTNKTTNAGQQVKRPRSDCNFSPVKANPSKKPVFSLPTRKLNKGQTAVLSAVLSGKNVFFTGSAGTGKSFLLKRIIGSLPPKSTFATASTGVAACHIGGTTLHNFAGIGSGSAPLEQCIELAQRPGVLQHWTSCQHLVIDEISMVDATFFDKLESVARSLRRSTEPFGGIQLIICGDFLQLPPVSKGKEKAKFCFQARCWHKVIQVNLELTEVLRQTDQTFISLLQSVRVGRATEEVTNKLIESAYRQINRDGIVATRLCTHKDDVELTNDNKLQQLPGTTRAFEAVDSDPALVKTIDAHSPVSRLLHLKVGAQVMLTKNLDVTRGLVNGARGVVVAFEPGKHGLPRVRFLCGVTEVLKLERWVFKSGGGTHLSRQQLPLKLAWAISIHKSQGMTLDCVEISLARVFESGQAYVALSRARSLEGLRVMDFDPRVVRADPDVLVFYKKLRKERLLMQSAVEDYTLLSNKDNTW
ncbi:ATP-dependent DNA helicase PIF1 isoform X1 [Hippocampus zosterae]|uniref:ATP-dependent DNA helicase PIF1 isoform X1 n=1 Tax=Hippocampus zosterae TaxID=109293 RepID=UPI00223D6720|nr:ATP-dependent DNA helicase PIF1 isoform X1 [Hippocampus zosterae]XP_051944650.1 ATP-dependent DNA helicase PIF1 isoform X1 [Hippocampus zosterae]XP_051944651.1 ATP-dependent DNA helicase PIF1 isoform X1 [Hippocampus zosterae]XP_051944653.1 ATP-dependent DNA helicase PIF1 isoform X1 [Hippocampus zosterae]